MRSITFVPGHHQGFRKSDKQRQKEIYLDNIKHFFTPYPTKKRRKKNQLTNHEASVEHYTVKQQHGEDGKKKNIENTSSTYLSYTRTDIQTRRRKSKNPEK